MKNTSIWLEGLNYTPSNKLEKDISVDVLIIGGGITGISTAYNLINSNLKVCLVEKNTICHGVTSRTTGKLTYLQELIYSDLKNIYNEDIARQYLVSQKNAIRLVRKIIKENNIDCDFERSPSYVFTNDENEIDKIKAEKSLLETFKVKVYEHNILKDNENVKYAISVSGCAVFHPVKYLISLKRICEENNIEFFESTKIVSINKENEYICHTENNIIKAKKVILAMHYPYFLFPFLMPFKTHLEKSYLMAYEAENKYFNAITSTTPTKSLRYMYSNNKTYKIELSNSHNIAFKNNDSNHYKDLLKNKNPEYIWSNKDIITSDKLPYIGEIKKNLYIATGYNTWGMTNASLAGKILSDLVQDKNNKYKELFNPKRHMKLNCLINLPINLTSNIYSFTTSKLVKNKYWYKDNIIFTKRNGKNIAIYTDENNKKHIVYNRCPHLTCGLIFNQEEKTWDCPCHGSRFDIDGKCIEGPSNYDISYNE